MGIDAAWLSKGFCSTSKLLVCAVLDGPAVRYAMDATVIFEESHVVPVALATGRWGTAHRVGGIGRRQLPALCLLRAHVGPARLKRLGVSAAGLREVGFTASELQVGFTASELREAGFTLSDLHAAGSTFE